MAAANVGTLLGNLVGALLETILTEEQTYKWGWRIPFLSGIMIAFVAMYLRTHGVEHHPNARHYDEDDGSGGVPKQQIEPNHVLREVFKRENLPALGSATLVSWICPDLCI